MPRHNLAAATLFTMETTLQVLKKYFIFNLNNTVKNLTHTFCFSIGILGTLQN